MKYFFYALMSLLILILFMLFSLFKPPFDTINADNNQVPLYHLVMITQGSKDPFGNALSKGALEAADALGASVELIAIPANDTEKMADAIDRAILSDADAIALQPINDLIIADRLKKAELHGIPVITFENDAFTLEGIPTIGSSSYNIGQSAANMAIAATAGQSKIALLLNDKQSLDPRYKSLKLQGIIEKLSAYPNMEIVSIHTVDADLFEADRLTRSLLSDHPDINLIICTDERRTPGVAQAIVDLNAVGTVQIVGFGNMEQTIKYIEQGVIYGTICADGFDIGYTTVQSLIQLIQNDPISESMATTIYSYTLKNLGDYYERFTDTTRPQ